MKLKSHNHPLIISTHKIIISHHSKYVTAVEKTGEITLLMYLKENIGKSKPVTGFIGFHGTPFQNGVNESLI